MPVLRSYATLTRMASNHERDEFDDAELDRLYALFNGCAADGGPAGIGVQARDRHQEAN